MCRFVDIANVSNEHQQKTLPRTCRKIEGEHQTFKSIFDTYVMRIIVFGAGAIGSLIGGLLSDHHEVLFVGRGPHFEAVSKKGLKIVGKTKRLAHPMTEWDGEPFDVCLLTTKAYDTEKATGEVVKTFGKMPVVSFQNGLGNEEVIASIIGETYTIGGVTSHGANIIEPSVVFHAGIGETRIGQLDGTVTPIAAELAAALRKAGVATVVSTTIKKDIWKKTIVNAAINGLTSVLQCENGFLHENTDARTLLRRICSEGVIVAQAEGFDVDERVTAQAEKITVQTAKNCSSMLQDLRSNKKTEVHEIHGALVASAEKRACAVPFTLFLYHAIRAMENVRHLGWPNGHLASRRGP
jgi:2-dehydropantoate 2-reductase